MWQIEQRVNEEQSAAVTGTTSIADVIMQATGGQIPQDPQVIRQILQEIPEPVKRNLITDDFTAANIIIYNREVSSAASKELAKDLRDYTSEHPEGVNVTVTGSTVIEAKLLAALTTGRERDDLTGCPFRICWHSGPLQIQIAPRSSGYSADDHYHRMVGRGDVSPGDKIQLR